MLKCVGATRPFMNWAISWCANENLKLRMANGPPQQADWCQGTEEEYHIVHHCHGLPARYQYLHRNLIASLITLPFIIFTRVGFPPPSLLPHTSHEIQLNFYQVLELLPCRRWTFRYLPIHPPLSTDRAIEPIETYSLMPDGVCSFTPCSLHTSHERHCNTITHFPSADLQRDTPQTPNWVFFVVKDSTA